MKVRLGRRYGGGREARRRRRRQRGTGLGERAELRGEERKERLQAIENGRGEWDGRSDRVGVKSLLRWVYRGSYWVRERERNRTEEEDVTNENH